MWNCLAVFICTLVLHFIRFRPQPLYLPEGFFTHSAQLDTAGTMPDGVSFPRIIHKRCAQHRKAVLLFRRESIEDPPG